MPRNFLGCSMVDNNMRAIHSVLYVRTEHRDDVAQQQQQRRTTSKSTKLRAAQAIGDLSTVLDPEIVGTSRVRNAERRVRQRQDSRTNTMCTYRYSTQHTEEPIDLSPNTNATTNVCK